MPSLNGNALGLWKSIKIRTRRDLDAGTAPSSFHNNFSGAFRVEDDTGGPSRGTRIFLFAISGFFLLLILVGVIVFRMAVRHRARKHVREMATVQPEMKTWRKSVLQSLGLLEEEGDKENYVKNPSGSDGGAAGARSSTSISAEAPAPDVSPALRSPEPRYGYSTTAPVLDGMSASASSEGGKLPTIVVNSIEEDLSELAEASISILPRDDLGEPSTGQDYYQDDNDVSGNENADADKSSSSSCFSEEMLETMSSIAADLKRFNVAMSIDIEVKSVGSKRSSILLVGPADEQQPVPCSAETVDASLEALEADKAIETLEDILSDLERMVGKNSSESLSCYSRVSYPMATFRSNPTSADDFTGGVGHESDDSARTFFGAESNADMTLVETAPLAVVGKKTTVTFALTLVKDAHQVDAVLPVDI